GLCMRLEASPVEKLALERCEEGLAHRVVVRVTDRAHRGLHADLATAKAETHRRVLAALIRVMDDRRRLPLPDGHDQSIDDAHTVRCEYGVHARNAVRRARVLVDDVDPACELGIGLSARGRLTLAPRVIAARRDARRTTQLRHLVHGLVRLYEPERFFGVQFA